MRPPPPAGSLRRMNLTRQTLHDRAGTQTTPVAPLNNDPGTQRITSPTLQDTALSTDDRLAIYELIALHGHLMDSGAFDRLHQLFTHDFVYDVQALGFGLLKGTEALTEASRKLGDGNPLGHHVTNVIVIADEDNAATVHSKGIGIQADGTSGTVVYEDLVRRTSGGWRIACRTVIPRHRPLHP